MRPIMTPSLAMGSRVSFPPGHAMEPLSGGGWWFIVCECGWRSEALRDRFDALCASGEHSQMRRMAA